MRRLARVFFCYIGGFILLMLLEGLSRNSFRSAWDWFRTPSLQVFLSLLACTCLTMTLTALPRLWTRCAAYQLLACGAALLGFVNHYKMIYRFEPLLVTDFSQLSNTVLVFSTLDFNFDIHKITVYLSIILAVSIAAAALFRKMQPRQDWLTAIAGVVLGVCTFCACTFQLAQSENRFDLIDQCDRQGLLYTAFAVENHRLSSIRQADSKETIDAAYETARATVSAESTASDDTPPNVILILYESFADEGWLSQYVELMQAVTPFYSSLRQTCRTGRIFVPKVGGGTSETEFEVLTGISSTWGFNPYCLSLPKLNSLASIFSSKGYETTCLHWYHGGYYNRYKNLEQMGFHQYYTTDTTDVPLSYPGMFSSDADHYRTAFEKLQSTVKKDFLFLITIQNHGGYTYADLGYPKQHQQAYSAQTELVLRNYIGLLKESDKALSEFFAELSALNEETWVICFSDHLPPFGAEVYEELGIDAVSPQAHMTPYFIWCSNPQKNAAVACDLYAFELGPYALSAMKLLDDPFMSYIDTVRKRSSQELTEARRGDFVYDILCRDALFGSQYSYQRGNISLNHSLLIGGNLDTASLKITELPSGTLKAALETDGWLSKARLYVNGTERSSGFIDPEEINLELQFRLFYADRVLNESGRLIVDSVKDLFKYTSKE